MKLLTITKVTDDYTRVYVKEFAEMLHDTFHYNVNESKKLAQIVIDENSITLALPIDGNLEWILRKVKIFGLEATIA